jgi:predicted phosphodiesterase
MRIAIFADIHGNLVAFEAALEHARRQGAERLIIAGDLVIGSPDAAACWRLACALGAPLLRGNHERYVFDYGTPQAAPAWSTRQFGPMHWAHGQLLPEERAAMAALPMSLRLPEFPDLLVVHGSLRSDADQVRPATPQEDLAAMFPGVTERLIVRAHDHIQDIRPWGRQTIVTAGSIGVPLDGVPTAQYVLLDQTRDGWQFRHQSVPYNLDAALARFADSGYLEQAGPIARLCRRELATATLQVLPFLRAYQRWREAGEISLEDGVERFLAF